MAVISGGSSETITRRIKPNIWICKDIKTNAYIMHMLAVIVKCLQWNIIVKPFLDGMSPSNFKT